MCDANRHVARMLAEHRITAAYKHAHNYDNSSGSKITALHAEIE
jgi:hypothetical protein